MPNSNLGSFERLEDLISRKKLGFLGEHILEIIQDLVSCPRIIQKQRTDSEEVYEYLKAREITIEFSQYGSSSERTVGLDRNFTLFSEITGAAFTQGPMHFYWNGSFEGLEFEIQKDVRILNNQFGFTIHNKGYNPAGNVRV
jgi:hypothetical protein